MSQASDISRRQLFRTAIAGTMGSAFVVLPRQAAGHQGTGQTLVDQAFEAQRKGDFAVMESLLRRAVAAGRTDEAVLRGLAWALCQQWKHQEAIRTALENHRRNPGPWSVAGVCETYVSAGDYDEARRWLRLAREGEHAWGEASPIFERSIEEVASKTYLLEYSLDPQLQARTPQLNSSREILFPVPFRDLPYQQSSHEVFGADRAREENINESLALRLTPRGDLKIRVACTVKVTPQSYRQKVRPFTGTDLPTELRPFTQATPHIQVGDRIVQDIARQLRGASSTATIENICRWSHQHLRYQGTNARDMDLDSKLCGGGSVAVLTRKSGHCEGQTSGTVALLRALGIPARFVRGHGGIAGASGVPTMHSWTEFYVPGAGWIQWDQNNAPFSVPAKICIGTFRYNSPYGVVPYGKPGSGDENTWALWFFYMLLTPPGSFSFRRVKQEL